MKKTFKYDFGEQTVEFDIFRLGELRRLDELVASLQDSASQGNKRATARIAELLPYLAAAAGRVDKSVSQDRLEELLDMYNFAEVFQGVLANSYGGGDSKGEATPVQ